jgi:hypothetical protein
MVNSEIHQGARENQVATFTILPDNSAYHSSWDNIEQPCIGMRGVWMWDTIMLYAMQSYNSGRLANMTLESLDKLSWSTK